MTQADLGIADAYINGDFSFDDKDRGLFNLFMVRILILQSHYPYYADFNNTLLYLRPASHCQRRIKCLKIKQEKVHCPAYHKLSYDIADNSHPGLIAMLVLCRRWWQPLLFTATIATAKYCFQHFLRQNSLTQARRNISRHYDLVYSL